jgi:hypothetical protein
MIMYEPVIPQIPVTVGGELVLDPITQMGLAEVPEKGSSVSPGIVPFSTIFEPAAGAEGKEQRGAPG